MTVTKTVYAGREFDIDGRGFFYEADMCYCELCGGEFKKEELTEGFCAECSEIDKDC